MLQISHRVRDGGFKNVHNEHSPAFATGARKGVGTSLVAEAAPAAAAAAAASAVLSLKTGGMEITLPTGAIALEGRELLWVTGAGMTAGGRTIAGRSLSRISMMLPVAGLLQMCSGSKTT